MNKIVAADLNKLKFQFEMDVPSAAYSCSKLICIYSPLCFYEK